MSDLDNRLSKLEKMNKKNKPLKKFKGDGEADTRLEPYRREKIDVRDVEDLIEIEDLEEFE